MTGLMMEPEGFVERQQRFVPPITTKGAAGVHPFVAAAAVRSVSSPGWSRVRARVGFAVLRWVAHGDGRCNRRRGERRPRVTASERIQGTETAQKSWSFAAIHFGVAPAIRRCSLGRVLGQLSVQLRVATGGRTARHTSDSQQVWQHRFVRRLEFIRCRSNAFIGFRGCCSRDLRRHKCEAAQNSLCELKLKCPT
jgi:hypothetical protein